MITKKQLQELEHSSEYRFYRALWESFDENVNYERILKVYYGKENSHLSQGGSKKNDKKYYLTYELLSPSHLDISCCAGREVLSQEEWER